MAAESVIGTEGLVGGRGVCWLCEKSRDRKQILVVRGGLGTESGECSDEVVLGVDSGGRAH